jgi:phosphohistidine phosphatase
MKLTVIRHGLAVERQEAASAAQPDDARPLTEKGRRRMKRVARGLALLVPHVDLLASSPLLRAGQTAELLARHYTMVKPLVVPELAPSVPLGQLLDWLRGQQSEGTVAVVGHEGGLSTFVSWLVSGRPQSHLALKKGGACLIEFPNKVEPGAARLEWLLTPRQLRRLR